MLVGKKLNKLVNDFYVMDVKTGVRLPSSPQIKKIIGFHNFCDTYIQWLWSYYMHISNANTQGIILDTLKSQVNITMLSKQDDSLCV